MLNNKQIYAITRLVVDGTLANCEYTSGKKIDHIGGGTSPYHLQGFLDKLKIKYID